MSNSANFPHSIDEYRALDTESLLVLLAEKDAQIAAAQTQLNTTKSQVKEQKSYINILEEYLRLARIKQFGPGSEKLNFQIDLFDEAELEVALAEFETQLPEEDLIAPPEKQTRKRGFSKNLNRVRIELPLREEEKAGAHSTFFTKVKGV